MPNKSYRFRTCPATSKMIHVQLVVTFWFSKRWHLCIGRYRSYISRKKVYPNFTQKWQLNFQVQRIYKNSTLSARTWNFQVPLHVNLKAKSQPLPSETLLSGWVTRLALIILKAITPEPESDKGWFPAPLASKSPGRPASWIKLQHCTGAPLPNGSRGDMMPNKLYRPKKR